MKRFKDLTELEIKDLSYDDLEKYILIECAENGVEIVDCPEKPVFEDELEKDEICYVVGGYPSIYLKFSNIDEATRLVDFLNSLTSIKTKDATSFYHVEKKLEYSDEMKSKNEKIRNRNKDIETKYNRERENYDKYLERRSDFSDSIVEKYQEIKEKYERLDMIKRKYVETYLPLSDNDETIAKRFLRDSFHISEEEEKYVFA